MAAVKKGSRARWWATIGIGAIACAGCCAIAPMLVAVGLVGGGALLAGAHWLEPLGFALIAIGVVGLVVTQTRKQRRRGNGRSCGGVDDAAACECCTPAASASPDRVS